jgi:K+-sensing histidine kinase KdpD
MMAEVENKTLAEIRHKIVNSMTVILGNTQILLEGLVGGLNEKQKERILKIKESAEALTKFIKEQS